jgi:hypothetical protein
MVALHHMKSNLHGLLLSKNEAVLLRCQTFYQWGPSGIPDMQHSPNQGKRGQHALACRGGSNLRLQ